MRILQVSSARAFGGGERHLADLARGLATRGHEVFAALAHDSPLRDELDALPPRNLHTMALRNALDIGSALKLARVALDEKVDVIHAHVARDYTLASLAARRATGARLVITRHVLFPLSRLHRRALSNVSRVIAVGDTPYDAEAAGKAGLRTVGFLCGGFPEEDLRAAGCIRIYRDAADLLAHYDSSPLASAG